MSDNMKALATRAVACKHWRWVPGMLASGSAWTPRTPGRVVGVDTDYDPPALDVSWDWSESDGGIPPDGVLPVLSDAATLGCLLALVREAAKAPVWVARETEPDPLDDDEHVITDRPWWIVFIQIEGCFVEYLGEGTTEAAALVAALEAAP